VPPAGWCPVSEGDPEARRPERRRRSPWGPVMGAAADVAVTQHQVPAPGCCMLLLGQGLHLCCCYQHQGVQGLGGHAVDEELRPAAAGVLPQRA
jgi:hypothetical protein